MTPAHCNPTLPRDRIDSDQAVQDHIAALLMAIAGAGQDKRIGKRGDGFERVPSYPQSAEHLRRLEGAAQSRIEP